MVGPRDNFTGLAVPVNPLTRQPVTDVQLARLERVREAYLAMELVLSEIGGTQPEQPKGSRNLAAAQTKLDECLHWAIADIFA